MVRMQQMKKEEVKKPDHIQTKRILSFQDYIKHIRKSNPNHSYARCLYAAKQDGYGWYEEYKSHIRKG